MRSHPVLGLLAGGGIRLGLDRIAQFLHAVGDPHLAAPVIHVAGTNGKGSVCAYVTAALVAAGYRVGTYTSPHLSQVNERFRLDGVPVDDARLTEAIGSLDRDRQVWGAQQGFDTPPLTYFEFVTALAFQLFAEAGVDLMVIEVGLGGRLDATNVVEPIACAITSIGLDHTEQLGDTLGQIAAEKAGILKAGVPAAIGPVAPEALASIRRRAEAVGAPLWTAGAQLRRERREDGWVLSTPEGTVGPTPLAFPGVHQGSNAAVAVGVLHLLRRARLHLPDTAIAEGLSSAHMPGRLEELAPGLWADGAHNAAATEALARWLADRPRPGTRILLFGMGSDRHPGEVLAPLLPHVDEVVLTQCAHPKARTPAQIADHLGPLDVLLSDGGPIEACLGEVYDEADEVLVTGSLFVVGAARDLVREGALDEPLYDGVSEGLPVEGDDGGGAPAG